MILVALGSNLPSHYGSPVETLEAAFVQLSQHEAIDVIARSDVYMSAPVPVSDQPWYHNAVIAVETDLKPFTLLAVLQEIEADFGRERALGSEGRNAARTLDLDIIGYHDVVLDEVGLEVPHPRMAGRAFVLYPLCDVAPDWVHPVSGGSVSSMIDGLPDGQDIRKLEKNNAKAG